MTKQLVELMGGQIGVASTCGVGTEFWVEFPASNGPELAAATEKAVAPRMAIAPDSPCKQRTLLYIAQ